MSLNNIDFSGVDLSNDETMDLMIADASCLILKRYRSMREKTNEIAKLLRELTTVCKHSQQDLPREFSFLTIFKEQSDEIDGLLSDLSDFWKYTKNRLVKNDVNFESIKAVLQQHPEQVDGLLTFLKNEEGQRESASSFTSERLSEQTPSEKEIEQEVTQSFQPGKKNKAKKVMSLQEFNALSALAASEEEDKKEKVQSLRYADKVSSSASKDFFWADQCFPVTEFPTLGSVVEKPKEKKPIVPQRITDGMFKEKSSITNDEPSGYFFVIYPDGAPVMNIPAPQLKKEQVTIATIVLCKFLKKKSWDIYKAFSNNVNVNMNTPIDALYRVISNNIWDPSTVNQFIALLQNQTIVGQFSKYVVFVDNENKNTSMKVWPSVMFNRKSALAVATAVENWMMEKKFLKFRVIETLKNCPNVKIPYIDQENPTVHLSMCLVTLGRVYLPLKEMNVDTFYQMFEEIGDTYPCVKNFCNIINSIAKE